MELMKKQKKNKKTFFSPRALPAKDYLLFNKE